MLNKLTAVQYAFISKMRNDNNELFYKHLDIYISFFCRLAPTESDMLAAARDTYNAIHNEDAPE